MSALGAGVDSLGLFLSGGASNLDPDASLGGLLSSVRMRGMGALFTNYIPGIRIDNVTPACGEGTATLAVDTNGDLVFTPPGGTAGTPVTVADGASAIISGADANKSIQIFRETGLLVTGVATFELLFSLNGSLSMKNVTSAQRVAGATTYRALMLRAQGAFAVGDVRLWTPVVGGAQAVYSLASEVPIADTIQAIASETTAPIGLSWVTATTEGGALVIPSVPVIDGMGLWIRRVFPAAGAFAVQEDFQLAMKFKGV